MTEQPYETVLDESATLIAQAYAQFGDLSGYYLGQTSSMLQLRLFRPLYLQVSIFLLALLPSTSSLVESLKENCEQLSAELVADDHDYCTNHLQAYQTTGDKYQLFLTYCQEVVSSDALWMSTQHKNVVPQASISDRGYVEIQNTIKRIEAFVEAHA